MTKRYTNLIAWPLALLLCACCTTSSHAAIVVSLDVQPGTFQLYLEDDLLGDTAGTFGIALYGVPLQGGVLTLDHQSPVASVFDGASVNPIGFNNFRSPDGTLQISASQTVVPVPTPYLVPNFGRAAGNLQTVAGAALLLAPEQPIYAAKLLIASGTWLNTAPTINTGSVDFVASVFSNAGLTSTQAATIRVAAVPEPSSLGWALFAGIGFCFRRRTRRDCGAAIR